MKSKKKQLPDQRARPDRHHRHPSPHPLQPGHPHESSCCDGRWVS